MNKIIIGLLAFFGITGSAYAVSKIDLSIIPNNLKNVWFKFDDLFKKYSSIYGINWKWLKAIALNESLLGENELVKQGLASSDGLSYGLMQITLKTAKWLNSDIAVSPAQLNNPEFSIKLASKYLNYLSKIFPNDQRKIIMSYNQGEGNTKAGREYALEYYNRFNRWIEKINKTLEVTNG